MFLYKRRKGLEETARDLSREFPGTGIQEATLWMVAGSGREG